MEEPQQLSCTNSSYLDLKDSQALSYKIEMKKIQNPLIKMFAANHVLPRVKTN